MSKIGPIAAYLKDAAPNDNLYRQKKITVKGKCILTDDHTISLDLLCKNMIYFLYFNTKNSTLLLME
jgi:hypothetical protein